MKKSRNIIILSVILVLLIVAYAVITNVQMKKSAGKKPAKTKSIAVTNFDVKNINKIVLNSTAGNFTIQKNGTTWTVSTFTNAKVKSDTITNIENNLAKLTATQVVGDNPSDLSDYGLKPAKATATAYLTDGTSKTVSIGTSSADGSFYAMVSGDTKVYTISSAIEGNLESGQLELFDLSLGSIDSSSVNYMDYTKNGQKTVKIQKRQNQSDQEKSYNVNAYEMTEPYKNKQIIDQNSFTNMLNGLASITASGIADNDGSNNLAKYGLDNPSYDITVKDAKTTMHLVAGKDADSDSAYCRYNNSKIIYIIAKSVLSPFDTTSFQLINKMIYLPNIDTVDKVTITAPSKTSVLSMARTTNNKKTTTTFTLDGVKLADSAARDFYTKVIGLEYEGETTKSVPDKPEIRIEYTLNSGSQKTQAVDFCPYDNDNYAVYLNGTSEFIISKDKVQGIVSEVDNVKQKAQTKKSK